MVKKNGYDIATQKNYRKQGIAQYLTTLFMEAYYKEGLKPWWNCMKENEGSKKLAANAGLSCIGEGEFFWFEH